MLKFNEQTKVIFADDAPGVTYPVREIAEADIAGLVANGATVDASVAVAEAGSAAPGEALPTGTPADSGTNPGSSGPVSTESELGNVDAGTAQPASSGSDTSVQTASETGADLPRESHLLLLEHKLAAMHAKFKTGERILVDEFEQILGHIRAVL